MRRPTSSTVSATDRATQGRSRPDLRLWAAVAGGGACGGLVRVALEERWPAGGGWPWATLTANLAGAALLAYVVARLSERLAPTTYPRPFLGTGLCGGLTTFSALQIELVELLDAGRLGLAAGYLIASLVGGAAVVFVTLRLVRRARWRA